MITTIRLLAISSHALKRRMQPQRGAGENVVENSLKSGEFTRNIECGLISVRDDLVDDRSIISGTKPPPIPWILCGPDGFRDSTAPPVDFDGNHAEVRLAQLEYLADAGDGVMCQRPTRAQR